jgi:hypothetical protein
MSIVRFTLLIAACLFFLFAAMDWPFGPFKQASSYIPWGLFCWCLSTLFGSGPLWVSAPPKV